MDKLRIPTLTHLQQHILEAAKEFGRLRGDYKIPVSDMYWICGEIINHAPHRVLRPLQFYGYCTEKNGFFTIHRTTDIKGREPVGDDILSTISESSLEKKAEASLR